jgi:hypothetical protein
MYFLIQKENEMVEPDKTPDHDTFEILANCLISLYLHLTISKTGGKCATCSLVKIK